MSPAPGKDPHIQLKIVAISITSLAGLSLHCSDGGGETGPSTATVATDTNATGSTAATGSGTTGTETNPTTGTTETSATTGTTATATATTTTTTTATTTTTGGAGACAELEANGPSTAQAILAMQADTWMQLPGTHMRGVCPESEPDIQGVIGCSAVVVAWGGAAFDQLRSRLFVWGGGHNDYYGNEVYALDLLEGTWSRLTEPSAGPSTQDYDVDPLADGQPVSRHTYDGLIYLPESDSIVAHGGSMAVGGGETLVTWRFDLAEETWSVATADVESAPGYNGHAYNLSSAYDPISGEIYMRDPVYVHHFSPKTDSWSIAAADEHTYEAQTGAIAPELRLFFSAGAGEFRVFDLDAAADVSGQWPEGAANPVVAAEAPGLEYDPVVDSLVAWAGGAPQVFSLASHSWTAMSAAGAPTEAVEAGTYGRFAYMATLNAYVLLNSVDDDVWIYKLTAGCAPE